MEEGEEEGVVASVVEALIEVDILLGAGIVVVTEVVVEVTRRTKRESRKPCMRHRHFALDTDVVRKSRVSGIQAFDQPKFVLLLPVCRSHGEQILWGHSQGDKVTKVLLLQDKPGLLFFK